MGITLQKKSCHVNQYFNKSLPLYFVEKYSFWGLDLFQFIDIPTATRILMVSVAQTICLALFLFL